MSYSVVIRAPLLWAASGRSVAFVRVSGRHRPV